MFTITIEDTSHWTHETDDLDTLIYEGYVTGDEWHETWSARATDDKTGEVYGACGNGACPLKPGTRKRLPKEFTMRLKEVDRLGVETWVSIGE